MTPLSIKDLAILFIDADHPPRQMVETLRPISKNIATLQAYGLTVRQSLAVKDKMEGLK